MARMLSSGEVTVTITGHETTPFPKITKRGIEKKVNQWLLDNGRLEAERRQDRLMILCLKNENHKLPQATKDHINLYLFGEV